MASRSIHFGANASSLSVPTDRRSRHYIAGNACLSVLHSEVTAQEDVVQPLASRAKDLREEAEYAAKLLAEADEEANSKKGKKGGKGKPAKGKPEAAALGLFLRDHHRDSEELVAGSRLLVHLLLLLLHLLLLLLPLFLQTKVLMATCKPSRPFL